MNLKHPFRAVRSINQINLFTSLFAGGFIFLFAFLIIYQEYAAMKEELAVLEEEYLQQQKERIVRETDRALRFIEYKHKKRGADHPEATVKREIVEAIEQMRNEGDGTGYVFIYTFDGVNIADPILKQNAGKNLLDFTDPGGKKVIAELIRVSRQPEGGFVEYVWNKPIVNKLAPKISYAKAYEPWGWMVGSGVYLDSIREIVEAKKEAHKKKIGRFIFQVLLVAALLFAVVAALSRILSDMIRKEIDRYAQFFRQAAADYRPIDVRRLRFREFRTVAGFANDMAREIREKTSALEELNRDLEERVKRKTRKLQDAKEFAERLVAAQDRFMKNAIHEINTPLSIIFTNIDLIAMKEGKNPRLVKIEAASKIIHTIYSDLSYMVKKEVRDYPVEPLDLSAFVRERLAFFEDVAEGNALAFRPELAPAVPLSFNREELQRIVDNNLSNAIKYSDPETEIVVAAGIGEEGRPFFRVANRGRTVEHPEKLFARYYREDDARGGFGIGLNIVKEICDKNRVEPMVQSTDGTTVFRYVFPKEADENPAAGR